MMQPANNNAGTPVRPTSIARVAGYALETADKFMGKTANPVGIKSYRPYHSIGEDNLQNYLGMMINPY